MRRAIAAALFACVVLSAAPIAAATPSAKKPCAEKSGKEKRRCLAKQASKQEAEEAESKAEVDRIIDLAARGAQTLIHISGGNVSVLMAQYQVAESDWRSTAQVLATSRPANVPTSVAVQVSTAMTAAADALAALRQCYATVNPLLAVGGNDPCASASTIANARAVDAGAALRALLPYGTRSAAAVAALFQ
jgi:hypothetical protein